MYKQQDDPEIDGQIIEIITEGEFLSQQGGDTKVESGTSTNISEQRPPIELKNESPAKPEKTLKILNANNTKPAIVPKEKEKAEETYSMNELGSIELAIEDLEAPAEQAAEVFSCAHCDRSFPLQQLLEMHEQIHVRERTSECDECHRKFFSKYDLAKHMLTHTGERPHKCVVCSKSFSRYNFKRATCNKSNIKCEIYINIRFSPSAPDRLCCSATRRFTRTRRDSSVPNAIGSSSCTPNCSSTWRSTRSTARSTAVSVRSRSPSSRAWTDTRWCTATCSRTRASTAARALARPAAWLVTWPYMPEVVRFRARSVTSRTC